MVRRRRELEAAAALVIGLLANVAYLAAGTPERQQQWHYVTSGAALLGVAIWLAIHVQSPFARIGLAWLAWEQMQVAACGVDGYGLKVPMGSGLCVVQYGNGPYLVALAIGLALLPWLTKRRKRK